MKETSTIPDKDIAGVAIGKPDALKFCRLLIRGHKPAEAKIKAGYSKYYKTSILMKTLQVHRTLKTLQNIREELQNTLGTTITDSVEFAQEMRDNTTTADVNKLRANRQIGDFLGYNAPQLIDIRERKLIVDLAKLSDKELKLLYNEYSGEPEDD